MNINKLYHQIFTMGYKRGYADALKNYDNINCGTYITKDKGELLCNICKGKCFLYNTEYCNPDGLVFYDVTTCKNYNTEESWNFVQSVRS